jgi:hypothetical protein
VGSRGQKERAVQTDYGEGRMDKLLCDAEARGLREPTLYKYRLLFRQFQDFPSAYGLPSMLHFDMDWVRRLRASWPNKTIAARKKE